MKENKCSSCDLIQKYPGGMTKNIQDCQIFQHVKKKTLNILKKKPVTNN